MENAKSQNAVVEYMHFNMKKVEYKTKLVFTKEYLEQLFQMENCEIMKFSVNQDRETVEFSIRAIGNKPRMWNKPIHMWAHAEGADIHQQRIDTLISEPGYLQMNFMETKN